MTRSFAVRTTPAPVRGFHRPMLAVAVLLSLHGLPAAAGSVQGRIRVANAQEAERTIIYIEEVPESSLPQPPAAPIKLSQRGAHFAPSVLAVFKGSTVDFTNDDWVTHNVFSKSRAKAFDLGLYRKEEPKFVKFEQPGTVEIFCSIHPRMSGVILVLQNPYFTRPAADGSYTLPNVPAGEWKLRVYRPGLDADPVSVKVPAKGTVSADL
jgi:plastocyanin